MAITTFSQLIANTVSLPTSIIKASGGSVAGIFRCAWRQDGFPIKGELEGSTPNGFICNNNTVGAIPLPNTSGELRISKIRYGSEGLGSLIIVDRLWQCGRDTNGTIISALTTNPIPIASPTWPARDNNGSSNGEGVFIALETLQYTPINADATVTYTNSDNISNRIGSTMYTFNTNTVERGWYPVTLQSGDRGVKSVESVQFNVSGSSIPIAITAYRPIYMFTLTSRFKEHFIEPISGVIPTIPKTACLTYIAISGSFSCGHALNAQIYWAIEE